MLAVMMVGMPASQNACAEDDLVAAIESKTQARFEEIVDGVDGVMGIVVDDLAGEHRFAVNEDREFAQASAIKIPILMEVLKQAHEGKLKLSDRYWIEKKRQVAGSGILSELGDRTAQMSVEDLCVLMIVLSDNTATNMLIDLVGMNHVTETMASLGLKHTSLRRIMLDTAAAARGEENVSTPAEAAKIMRLLHEGKFINRKVSDHALAILRKDKPGAIKSVLPPGTSVASKPGEVPGVMTEWAIVELEHRPYVIVVMGSFGVDKEFKEAIRESSKAAYEFFHRLSTASKYGAYVDPAEWQKK
jgi:beta-lactamase class A